MARRSKHRSWQSAEFLRELQQENEHLRELVISLTGLLLRKFTIGSGRKDHAAGTAEADHLLRDADECLRCAKALDAAGHDFMAKAVAIETTVQRRKWSGRRGPRTRQEEPN
jgi:hypothetical protein